MRNLLSALRLLLTLKCDHSSHFISYELDDELSRVERWAMRLHFISCKSCRRFRNHIEFLRLAAQHLASTELADDSDRWRLTPEAKARIAAAIESER